MTLPRVSHILRAVGLAPDLAHVPPHVLEAAQRRGTLVHEAIEAKAYGYYDGTKERTEIDGYLDAHERFLAEAKYKTIRAEFRVEHPTWAYQGHPDSMGWIGRQRILIDWKTGVANGVDVQLAAYTLAWDAMHPNEPITAAACVELRGDGRYRFTEIELKPATQTWLAALTVFRAQAKPA